MTPRLSALAALVLVACGGLASSSGGDAGTPSPTDSGREDAATPDGAGTDAPACLSANPAEAWTVSHGGRGRGDPADALLFLQGVWGTGHDDVWAVGGDFYPDGGQRGAALHWNGSAWSPSSLPSHDAGAPLVPSAVWGSGPNDVWNVGGGDCGEALCASIQHWNGSLWSPWPLPTHDGGTEYGYSLQGIWGSGPSDVWAVGFSALIDVVLHWDGVAWSASPLPKAHGSPAQGYYLSSVWGSGPKDVWAVGGLSDRSGGTILHWDGSAWSLRSDAPVRNVALAGVWSSGPSDAWAVAAGSHEPCNSYGCSDGKILHWNGSVWSVSTDPTAKGGRAVWGSGPNDVWAVGGEHGVLHFDGDHWSASTRVFGAGLGGVWGSGACDVWAVGGEGRVFHHP